MTTASPGALVTRRRRPSPLVPVVALLVFTLDQLSKWLVQVHLAPCGHGPMRTILSGWVRLAYTCNSGAAFGLFPDSALLFIVIALLIVSALIALAYSLPPDRPAALLAIGLQTGGALGNVADRVRQGYVVDFIQVKIWPVFNVADSCIVVGTALLAWCLMTRRSPSTAAENS